MNNFVNLLILSTFFLVVFAIGEIAYRVYKASAEYTRKWSHIASGFLSLLFPYYFDSVLWVGIICGMFLVFLYGSKRLHLLPSINAVERHTHGSILFPAAVFLSYCAYKWQYEELVYFYLPVLTLAICDLSAAIVGKSYPIVKIPVFNENKSLGGLLAFLVSSLAMNYVFLSTGFPLSIFSILVISFIAAVVELCSPHGIDNITIPASVIVVLYVFAA
jgi:phytol kinase